MDPWGSGGGSVGRAVTSNARGPRFESSHRQSFLLDIYLFTIKYIEKTKIKKKEAENGPFLKKDCCQFVGVVKYGKIFYGKLW